MLCGLKGGQLADTYESFMMKLLLPLCSALLSLLPIANAAEDSPPSQTIPLWSDAVPGFPAGYQHHPFVQQDALRITETSQPFMRVFPADPSKATGHGMLIFPGGGYSILADQPEGNKVARYFASKGIACFVVCYRVSKQHADPGYRFPGPLLDARQAMRYVKNHAKDFKVDVGKIGVLGFSAGGHLAGMCATRYQDTFVGEPANDIDVRPAFSALIYPVVSMIEPNTHRGSRNNLLGKNPSKDEMIAASSERRVTKDTPPLFIVHNQLDPVTSQNSLLLALAATKAKSPCELHLYPANAHGFGMGKSGDTEQNQPAMAWPLLLEKFIKRQS